MAPKPTQVDAASLAEAIAQARKTGAPQPVRNSSGDLLFWVNGAGQQLDMGGFPKADPKDPAPPRGKPKTPAQVRAANGSAYDQSVQDAANSLLKQTIDRMGGDGDGQHGVDSRYPGTSGLLSDKATTQNAADATKLAAANQLRGYVWINGHLAQITGFAKDGTPIVSVQGGKASQKPTTGPDGVLYGTSLPANQTAFGALPASSGINGGAIFNLSAGPANIFTGQSDAGDGYGTPGTGYTPQGAGLTPAAAEHSQGAESVSNAKNQMTVAQGVQWFLNLSVQHPDQYKQLVDQLVAAHYITPSLGQSAGGGYGFDAAQGFAKATAELASVNTTPGGAGLGLFDFLKGKAEAAKQYAESQVQPVNRSYQDPATLKYVARNAAQAVLGRDLTPGEQQAFEAQFRGQEDGYYNGVDASNKAQAGAALMNTTAPGAAGTQPDATGEAQQYVYDPKFTTQRMGYSMLEYMKAFQDFLGSGKL